MEYSHALIGSVALKAAIDYDPLLVAPDASLLEVIAQMSQAKGTTCGLVGDHINPNTHAGPSKIDLGSIAQKSHDASSASQQGSVDCTHRQASCALIIEEVSNQSKPPVEEIGSSSLPNIGKQKVIGIFTERDIVKLVAKGMSLESLTIGQVMVSPVITLAESELQDIFAPLFLFRRYQIRHLLIVDNCDRPIGIVSPESIRAVLRPANLLKLRRVSDIMARDVICADYQVSILKTAQLMTDHRVSCIVMTEDDADRGHLPIGIITERDIVQFRTLELDFSIQAGTVMSSPLCLLNPDDSLWTAHQEMQRLNVRRLVVSWNWGKGLGLVTQTSLLKAFDPLEMYGVLETLQTTIQQLHTEKRMPIPSSSQSIVNIKSSSPPSPVEPSSPEEKKSVALNSQRSVLTTAPLSSQGLTPKSDTHLGRLSSLLKDIEARLAALQCVEGDRPKHHTILSDLTTVVVEIQHLEKAMNDKPQPSLFVLPSSLET